MIKHFDPIDILFILLISCYLIAFFSILFILWRRKYKLNKSENVDYASLQIPVVDKLEINGESKKTVEVSKKKENKKKITSISYTKKVNSKENDKTSSSKVKSKTSTSTKIDSKSKSKSKSNKTNKNTKNTSKKKINNSKRNNSVVSSTKKKKTTNRKKNKKSSKKK